MLQTCCNQHLSGSCVLCRDRGLPVLHGGHRRWKLLQEHLEHNLVLYGDEDPAPGRPHDSNRNTRPSHLESHKVVCTHPRAVHSTTGSPSCQRLPTIILTRRLLKIRFNCSRTILRQIWWWLQADESPILPSREGELVLEHSPWTLVEHWSDQLSCCTKNLRSQPARVTL